LRSAPRRHAGSPGRIGSSRWWLFGGLLVAPNLALQRLGPWRELWPVHAAWFAISVATYATYGRDKRRAEAGGARTPESTLHLLSLLGGWPGALLAQARHRHKTGKPGFQLVFWASVALHQLVAIDFLLGWPLAGAVAGSLR
jgi:uncharacterized membrane protein YsdA (DUF1294 family)